MAIFMRYTLAFLIVALLLGNQPVAAQNYTFKYSDIGPPRGPRAQSLMWWADEMEKRTGGRVKVKFFWSQSLVKGKETLKAVGSGLTETGTVLGVYTPADLPLWNFANAPFGVADIWVGMRTWYEMRQTVPELRAETAKKKVRILMNFSTGPVELLSKSPILSVRDLKGKKIRSTGGWTGLLKALGAVPVKIGFGEVYQALDRGTIDGTINYIPYVKSYKHFEVAGHVTEVRMGQLLGYGAGINLRLWNGMPKEIQKTITEVSEEFMDRYAQAYLADSDKAKKDLTGGIGGKRIQFHTLVPEERNRWAAKADEFTENWVKKVEKKGVDAKKIIAAFQRIRAKYEQELEAKGYPWTR
ncbi:MAG: C4-dicarboxylate TRAP transporter substrate-binding protein [Candidatus Methylomirabilia bacterium]